MYFIEGGPALRNQLIMRDFQMEARGVRSQCKYTYSGAANTFDQTYEAQRERC
jgi:hypothetical protein